MLIEIYSDVICPWCFIGKQRLDRVLASDLGNGIDLIWRPYQLYPYVPPEGLDRDEFIRAQYGEKANPKKVPNAIQKDGELVGIEFNYSAIQKIPNTLLAHRLLLYVEEPPLQHELAERLFHMYFCEGGDVGNIEQLVNAAVQVGLDGKLVRQYLHSELGYAQTLRDIDKGSTIGVAGVPCYRIGGMFLLAGAQPTDTIVQYIERTKRRLDRNTTTSPV